MEYARRLLKGKKYSQDELIPFLVLVIGTFKGKAYKYQVDEKLYEWLKEEFSHGVLHETVANNVPRWKHDIAWAKERAKQHHNYIKGAEESGRGVWELTENGKEFCKSMVKKLENDFKVVRRKKSDK